MKTVKFPILCLAVTLFAASCKKNDVQGETSSESTAATAASDLSWKTISQWENDDQGTFSVHYFTIADSSITADVADNGLVLVYKKADTNVNTLPFEEGNPGDASTASNTANYWYHQVSEGSLLVSCDVYTGKADDAANSFKYFVITPEKLESLASDGYDAEKLMNLSYNDAAALLNTAQ